MDWVAEGIAVAGWRDAVDQTALEAAGLEAVLQLYEPGGVPQGFRFARWVLQLPLRDAEPIPPALLRKGVEFITGQRSAGRRVLVTCAAGLSRSPTLVAAYLHEQGMDLLSAYQCIQQHRPGIVPHPLLVQSLVDYYGLPTPAPWIVVSLQRSRKPR